jgi:hypothetical protein
LFRAQGFLPPRLLSLYSELFERVAQLPSRNAAEKVSDKQKVKPREAAAVLA